MQLTKIALLGAQLRIYVQKRWQKSRGVGIREPRNLMRDMVTEWMFAETNVKEMMLWN